MTFLWRHLGDFMPHKPHPCDSDDRPDINVSRSPDTSSGGVCSKRPSSRASRGAGLFKVKLLESTFKKKIWKLSQKTNFSITITNMTSWKKNGSTSTPFLKRRRFISSNRWRGSIFQRYFFGPGKKTTSKTWCASWGTSMSPNQGIPYLVFNLLTKGILNSGKYD